MTQPGVTAAASDNLRVSQIGDRAGAWDRFVAQAPGSTFAHRAEWRDVVRDVFGHESAYLVAESDATWRGVLPLVHVRGLLGHYLLSMPFLNDGGPIGDAPSRERLTEAAVVMARDTKAKELQLRSRESTSGPVGTSLRKVAVHLALPATVEELWEKTFKAKLRSQIRRPSKEGMTARAGHAELDAFYSVFCRNMRDLGTPVLPRAFFVAIARAFGDDVMFVTVYSAGGVPAAAACCLTWRGEMEITWASSVREFNPLSPNMLLYATAMEEAIRRGVRTFNFGRSTPGAPTHRFKLQWGGHDVPLPWGIWPAPAENDSGEHGRVMGMAVAAWSRLPLPVANRLGPMISGQLPW